MSICRNICANGSPPGPGPKAISSSRSTSIRRAFCKRPAVKKPAVIGDGRLDVQEVLTPLLDATLTEPDGRTRRLKRLQETTSAVTRPTPAPVRPTARAAPVDRV